MAQENNLYLLIHTMTIADNDFVLQAHFFHAFSDNLTRAGNGRLIGRRFSLRIHPSLRRNRNKLSLQRLQAPNLRTLMKRNSAVIKHNLRTVHIGPERSHVSNSQNENFNPPIVAPPKVALTVTPPSPPETKKESPNVDGKPNVTLIQSPTNNQITQYTTPEDTVNWLTANRFEKYLDSFSRFSGSDMLLLSRDDLIDICGQADGIRLHNALHLKAIVPKLKIYVCQENSSVFNGIFLSSHNNAELLQKLCNMLTITSDQVKAIYIEGPHSIHVHLSDDVLRHVEEETMFSLSVLQDKGNYILLLKRKISK